MNVTLFSSKLKKAGEKVYFLFVIAFVAEIALSVFLIPISLFVTPVGVAETNVVEISELRTASAGILASVQVMPAIFSAICQRGGKISAFSFDRTDRMCLLTVYGCKCEDVVNAQYTTVAFRECEPVFSLSVPLDSSVFSPRSGTTSLISPHIPEDYEIVRLSERLSEFNAHIQAKRKTDQKSELSVLTNSSVLYSVLHVCAEFVADCSLREESVSLKLNGDECEIRLVLAENSVVEDDETSILLTAARFAYLFSPTNASTRRRNALFPISNARYPLARVEGAHKQGDEYGL